MQQQNTKNVFLAAAQSLWAAGHDGEFVAMDLVAAFAVMTAEGTGATTAEDITKEFVRMLTQFDLTALPPART